MANRSSGAGARHRAAARPPAHPCWDVYYVGTYRGFPFVRRDATFSVTVVLVVMVVVVPFNEYDPGDRKILTVPFVNYSPRPRRTYTSFVRRRF